MLGPERIAKIARELGKLIRNIKAYFNSLSDELKIEMDILDDLKKIEKDLKS